MRTEATNRQTYTHRNGQAHSFRRNLADLLNKIDWTCYHNMIWLCQFWYCSGCYIITWWFLRLGATPTKFKTIASKHIVKVTELVT